MTLATINSVWIGPELGPVHAACLYSFVRHGHRVVLHAYSRPVDLPSGVELADADKLLPSDRIVRYARGGSPSLFSNLLRYEILRQDLGVYVDCDCYCIRPINDSAEYLFGYESPEHINGAVLRLPADSEVLRQLCALKDMNALIPPWAAPRRRAYYQLRAALGVPVGLKGLPWGTTGPRAVTWYIKQNSLQHHAAPIDRFYPLHPGHVGLLLDPGLRLDDLLTPRTQVLHLWNEGLKQADLSQIAADSPLGAILASSGKEGAPSTTR